MRGMLGLLGALVFAGAPAMAEEAPPAASSCSGCHAIGGTGEAGVARIGGRDAGEMAAVLTGFRSGARPGTLMGRIMKGFSEDEIRALAGWLATQK